MAGRLSLTDFQQTAVEVVVLITRPQLLVVLVVVPVIPTMVPTEPEHRRQVTELDSLVVAQQTLAGIFFTLAAAVVPVVPEPPAVIHPHLERVA
jgi:hypothetical protein